MCVCVCDRCVGYTLPDFHFDLFLCHPISGLDKLGFTIYDAYTTDRGSTSAFSHLMVCASSNVCFALLMGCLARPQSLPLLGVSWCTS